MMNVLVCTASTIDDPGLGLVTNAIEARGGKTFRLETDRFPAQLKMTMAWDNEDRMLVSDGKREFDLSRVSSVWISGMETGLKFPDGPDSGHQEAIQAGSNSMIWGMLESLKAFKLDPPESLRRAPYRPRQLQLAREVGLEIPRTIITNSPDQVRKFAATCKHGVIAKMVDSTGRIETEHSLEGLSSCPVIFQESVPKALELRITVVGTQVFIAAVESASSTDGADDSRRDNRDLKGFQRFDRCPKSILQRLLAMLTRLGLNFATVDLILTPDGRYVFLEFNTSSGFAFIENATKFPISGAIADLLLGRTPSRIPS